MSLCVCVCVCCGGEGEGKKSVEKSVLFEKIKKSWIIRRTATDAVLFIIFYPTDTQHTQQQLHQLLSEKSSLPSLTFHHPSVPSLIHPPQARFFYHRMPSAQKPQFIYFFPKEDKIEKIKKTTTPSSRNRFHKKPIRSLFFTHNATFVNTYPSHGRTPLKTILHYPLPPPLHPPFVFPPSVPFERVCDVYM